MDAITVESEMGDIWPPAIEPDKRAPNTGANRGTDPSVTKPVVPENVTTKGTAKGIIIATVPHADPVDAEISVEVIKIITGNVKTGTEPKSTCAK